MFSTSSQQHDITDSVKFVSKYDKIFFTYMQMRMYKIHATSADARRPRVFIYEERGRGVKYCEAVKSADTGL